MNYSEYLKTLQKVSLVDIIDKIKEDLNNNESNCYGFQDVGEGVLFGELLYGCVMNPSVFVCENDNNACQDLYDLLQGEFSGACSYIYGDSFGGGYDYYACNINGGQIEIDFPNYKPSHLSWINKQVNTTHRVNTKHK